MPSLSLATVVAEREALARLAELLAVAHGVDWPRMPPVAQAGYMAKIRDILIEAGFLEPDEE